MKLVLCSLLFVLSLTFLTGHAWADNNMTLQIGNAPSPMFNPANIKTNTYSDPTYNFSITPPQGWIPINKGNGSDSALVEFANENPDREATFAIYYYQGKPISDLIRLMPDSEILNLTVSKLFSSSSNFIVYQKNIQRFSDGFVIAALAAKNDTAQTSPAVEEFSFWMEDGRQYFLVMVSSRTGFQQNALEFERSAYTFYVGAIPSDVHIPPWVKNNAKWWSEGTIDDQNFVNGIKYLIEKGIIVVPHTSGTGQSQQIPMWIKNSAGWWAQGVISDDDFVKGIQYLISNGIIKL
ncbi:MAG TPA: hypothetical protein VJ771_03870 [Candidatus Nitrosotalea sp.]|nr:hypothetical protein [Candidatus Nitrosotalea sp.]